MMILSVFISEGSRQSREKLVNGHVHFCGEVSGEMNCKSHEDVMGQNLKRIRKNNTKWTINILWIIIRILFHILDVSFWLNSECSTPWFGCVRLSSHLKCRLHSSERIETLHKKAHCNYLLTLKFTGSMRNLVAWSSLKALIPPIRSSILPTASVMAFITVLPCFFTSGESREWSVQSEKYILVWG